MEEFLILLLLAVIVIMALRRGRRKPASAPNEAVNDMAQQVRQTAQYMQRLHEEMRELRQQTTEISNTVRELRNMPPSAFAAPGAYMPGNAAPVADSAPAPEPAQEVYTLHEPLPAPAAEQPIIAGDEEAINEPIAAPAEMPEPVAAFTQPPPNAAPPPYVARESGYDRWLRNNPDLEKFIGENLINKIGIAVLVLGIAFFVKYAIDQNWINETGRVCIGMGCGAILVGLAHYMRNSYRSFSSVLAGGGIAVFYFTIAFAFHQYHLLPQTAAFVIMVVITAFAVALSVLYDKLELAIIATIGGFLAPFLVSSGGGNYQALFIYLIILNAGLLSLAYFKRWTSVNIIALFFTEIIFGGWLGTLYFGPSRPVSYPAGLLFATVFYVLFLGMNMIYQVRNKAVFKAFDFMLLLFISATYYAAGMALLHLWNNGAYQGIFTLIMGFVNLALAYIIYRKGYADRNLLFLLIGLTVTFLTLTIPIQLHGHAITMFWAAEFVLLYWLSVYSGIRIFRYSSALICLLSVISLLMDWGNAGSLPGMHLAVIYTNVQGVATNAIAIAAFTVMYFLLRREGYEEDYLPGVPAAIAARISLTAAVALLYLTCIFGVNLANLRLTSYDIPNAGHRVITELFALAGLLLLRRYRPGAPAWVLALPLAACFLMYIFSTDCILGLRDGVLAGRYAWGYMLLHWVASLLLAGLFIATIQGIRKGSAPQSASGRVLGILLAIAIIIFLSIELMHIYIAAAYSKGNTGMLAVQFGKAGLTVIWALCSFALMWLGMRHGNKPLRILSLTIFSIVLLKLFIVDISHISEGGKILAFILLGVLLLTVSFMYQKLKKMIIDDKKE